MEKTKLGLSVSVMGVVLTLLGYYAGYIIRPGCRLGPAAGGK